MASQDYFAVGSAALNTSTGTQDLTVSGLGWTPKACILMVTTATANATYTDHAVISIGMADDNGAFTNNAMWSENSAGNTDTGRYQKDDSTNSMQVFDGTGISSDGVFEVASDGTNSGPISNGWRIDISTAPSSAYLIKYILIGGTGVDAHVGTFLFPGGSGAATVTPGFETNLMFTATGGISNSSGSSLEPHHILTFGAASYNGSTTKQGAVYQNQPDNEATSSVGVLVEDNEVTGQYFNGSVAWRGDVTSISSTQVQITSGESAGGDDVNALCISLPSGVEADVSVIDSPTSAASDWTVTGVGFQPDFALVLSTMATAVGSGDTKGNAGQIGFHALDGTAAFTASAQIEDDTATDNTSSLVDSEWLNVSDHQGSQSFDINPASSPFNSDGWTVDAADIGAADGTTRKWLAISVGEEAASGVTGTATPTESADTSSASGTVTGYVTGTATPTEAADTSTASGSLGGNRTGTASPTESADTSTASGIVSVQISGSAAITEVADISTASGTRNTSISGTAAITEGADYTTTGGKGGYLPGLRGDETPEELRRLRNARYRQLRAA